MSRTAGFGPRLGFDLHDDLSFRCHDTQPRHSLSLIATRTLLTPKTTISVETQTRRSSILEYLFSPLVETSSSALRER